MTEMTISREQLLSIMKERIASGAGLQDHTVYGAPVALGMGKAVAAEKKKRAKKSKVEKVVDALESAVPLVVETAAAPVNVIPVLAGKKKCKKAAGAPRAGNAWLDHIKAVQKEKGLTYSAAMKEAAKTYKK